jgi:uncharacterized membrane protein
MTQITELQYDDLKFKIYETLINMDDMGLGEITTCTDEARSIVDEWVKDNNITII